jgi:hypothetical protein
VVADNGRRALGDEQLAVLQAIASLRRVCDRLWVGKADKSRR